MSSFLRLLFSLIFLLSRKEVRGYCMELENVVPLDPLPGSHHHLDTWNGQGKQLQLTKWKNSFELDQP
jgi:hypothetical protein